jgi:hypothetical protein
LANLRFGFLVTFITIQLFTKTGRERGESKLGRKVADSLNAE